MDWSNEPYVRVYTRETDDDLALSWEAMALWNQIMKRFDRSGFVETRRGSRGLAAITRIPLQVVERALPELLEDGRLVAADGGFVAPNFIAAQEATKSDRQRQKDSRDRRRARALDVTIRDGAETACDGAVTVCDANVTHGHEPSRPVTLCSADPPVADPLPIPPPARAIPQQPERKALGDQAWNRLNAMRAELAEANSWTDVSPLHPMDPGRSELAQRIVECGAEAEQRVEHVLQVAFAEARTKNTVEYLSGSMFELRSWRKKLAMRVDDAKAQRAGPRKSAGALIGAAEPRSDHPVGLYDFNEVSR